MDKINKKLGRNDKCWCGSGKKYKNCHYEIDRKNKKSIYNKPADFEPLPPEQKRILGIDILGESGPKIPKPRNKN